MKYRIMLLLIFSSLLFISCDSDYSGDVSDSFNMYYAVEGGDSSLYTLEYYVNSTNGILKFDSLTGNYLSDTLEMKVTEADSFYMKVVNFHDDTLQMFVYKGLGVFADSTLFGVDSLELKGRFDHQ